MPITLKIDVKKIRKDLLFVGAKGTYLDLVLFENRDGPGQYGDTHYVVQGVSKERKEAGEKGPIIGNAKVPQSAPAQQRKAAPVASRPPADPDLDGEDAPF